MADENSNEINPFLHPVRWYRDGGPDDPFAAEIRQTQIRLTVCGALAVLAIVLGLSVYQYVSTLELRSESAYLEGEKLLRPGGYQDALKKFDRAISLNGSNEKAHLGRGSVLALLGNRGEAIAEFSKVIELKPNWSRGYAARGRMYRDAGDIPKAMADLNQSVELEPSPENLIERGQAYANLGDWKKAAEDYTAYIKIREGVPYPYTLRAIARARLGDEEGAKEDKRQALVYEGKLKPLFETAKEKR